MTCVIGFNTKHNRYIAADTRATSTYGDVLSENVRKLHATSDKSLVAGVAGPHSLQRAVSDVVRCAPLPVCDLHAFADALKERCEQLGITDKGTVLLAHKGGFAVVSSDFTVMWCDDHYAVGSGKEIAWGYMEARPPHPMLLGDMAHDYALSCMSAVAKYDTHVNTNIRIMAVSI
jgi:ATP-dependent protease HslVU (ClpYQ) peptidase subunit